MAKQRKVKVLDSYQTLKAVRTTARNPSPRVAKPHRTATAQAAPPEPPKSVVHIGRTTIPSRHVIICYECGYQFQLHGRIPRVPCSKCRADLDLTEHEVTGPWTKSLKTATTVRIQRGAVIRGADLVGKQIILEGRLVEGSLRALERLELRAGAEFPEASISTVDLTVGAGAEISFQQPVTYREVEIS
ncbi:polymer-forming cytoskeletal protein, partial [bacterium]|nr:polymer-forming cytoskeletal protein [bacterium]